MKTIKLIMMTLALTTILTSCGESESERALREIKESGRVLDSISRANDRIRDSIEYQSKIDEINAEFELEMVKIKNGVQ